MKTITLIFTLIFSVIFINAQDVIYKTDGTEIKTKILEVTTETIKYKKFEQLEGPVRNILLSDVFMIIYKDGTREVFKKTEQPKSEEVEKQETPIQAPQVIPRLEEKFIEIEKSIEKNKEPSSGEKCMLGTADADNLHGKVGNHILWGILFGPFAVIGAAASNPTPEKGMHTLTSNNRNLFNDPVYRNCYTKKARGKNVGNTVAGWGMWLLFVLVVAAGAS